jgi:hypothetical protein
MSQHDFNIANQGFPGFRSDLNNALVALATLSSGGTAPTATFAYQHWVDTSTSPPTLKIRNGTNDGWISVTLLNSSTNVSTPVIITQSTSDNSTNPASTAYVINRIANDAPTKTGTGASGTWGISITGNAATVGGFTPVQQGGGAGQGTNKVYIGWLGSTLGVQVDSTDFAATWPISVTGNAGSATTATTATNVTNVTTNQVLGAIAGATAGAVGTYALLGSGSNGPDGGYGSSDININSVVAGSKLRPTGFWKGSSSGTNDAADTVSNGDAWMASENTAQSGTWKCMGFLRGGAGWAITLWLRIT